MQNDKTPREIIAEHEGNIVGYHRQWNNSMYIYHDTISVWMPEKGKAECVFVGCDVFDGLKPESLIDTDGDVFQEYHRTTQERKKKAEKAQFDAECKKYSHHGENAEKIVSFLSTLTFEEKKGFGTLLSVKNFRSNFRKSLCQQTIGWLETPKAERKYPFPLSPRQKDCLVF